MFREKSLRQHPAVIKAFMGLPAAAFWELIEHIKEQLPAHEAHRLERANRQRTVGGGRNFDQPLVIRVALVLTYLRLHIPQEVPTSGNSGFLHLATRFVHDPLRQP